MSWLSKNLGNLRLLGFVCGVVAVFTALLTASSKNSQLVNVLLFMSGPVFFLSAALAIPHFLKWNLTLLALFSAVLNVVIIVAMTVGFVSNSLKGVHSPADLGALLVYLPFLLIPIVVLAGLAYLNLANFPRQPPN